MDELQYEQEITLLGQLRARLQRLEETEYMTAYYKGYSSSGMTVEEIKVAIEELSQEIQLIEEQLAGHEW
ncbi:hypothetical protein [Enterococcus hermanniensis]|uniref:Uncharacterized protein n=1 Tax=Enterococcus hermanniensis TaxID=249189 RepID=A0A1L8TM15_9ENTE|nr:hypothetical protein [Enterococcus hermanniensis]OJG45379.1 hypothetical protein RV04_GL002095 [Enterococcus hermanniensis]